MKYKKKFLVEILIILMMILLMGCFIILYQKKNKMKEADLKIQSTELTPIATILPEEMDLSQTVSEKDEMLSDYPYRVKVSGMANIAEVLPDDACYMLEPYLSQYINYYDKNTENYNAEIVPDSYNEDLNWPSFHVTVHIEDTDIDVKCIYWICGKYYDFYSSLSN